MSTPRLNPISTILLSIFFGMFLFLGLVYFQWKMDLSRNTAILVTLGISGIYWFILGYFAIPSLKWMQAHTTLWIAIAATIASLLSLSLPYSPNDWLVSTRDGSYEGTIETLLKAEQHRGVWLLSDVVVAKHCVANSEIHHGEGDSSWEYVIGFQSKTDAKKHVWFFGSEASYNTLRKSKGPVRGRWTKTANHQSLIDSASQRHKCPLPPYGHVFEHRSLVQNEKAVVIGSIVWIVILLLLFGLISTILKD